MTDQQAWKAEVLAKIEELETRLRESSGHVLALQDLLLKAAAEAEAREKPARILERITNDDLVEALHLGLSSSEAGLRSEARPAIISLDWLTWFSLTLALSIAGILAIGIGGTIAAGFGMPLAWRIDRATYSWAEEGEVFYELPSYETREATPPEVDDARSLP